jgi:hypothetical protein
MRKTHSWLSLMALLIAWAACTEPYVPQSIGVDAGSRCVAGYTVCGEQCCAGGMRCEAGRCEYPYSSAHLYVYLCPSFNTGTCRADFLSLEQTCTPVQGPQQGVCYDTGFELAADRSYALASCLECGKGCSSPGSFKTPPGFVSPHYYSGITLSCTEPCEAPPDCGGPKQDAKTRCSTADCWLSALAIEQEGKPVEQVVISQPLPSTGTVSAMAPRVTQLNGVTLTTTSTAVTLAPIRSVNEQVPLEYDFLDPTGCSPGVCFSMPRCPTGVRCAAGTKAVCTHAKRDGLTVGTVMRTLGFKAEPTTITTTELPLEFQLIAGPVDPSTGLCTDPFDSSTPNAPTLVQGVLISEAIELNVTIGPLGSTPPPDAGVVPSDAGAPEAGAGNDVCCCDFRTPENMWHCTNSLRSDALCNVPWPECCNMEYTICD